MGPILSAFFVRERYYIPVTVQRNLREGFCFRKINSDGTLR
jgi:hypothetical protein